jgi:hypothetical protein
MEYPMICFNGARPEADGTYSEGTKAFMIGVIIHEVGHNFFPMIVNSDERQWSWMDEGLNTFCEQLAEKEWDRDFDTSSGEPQGIVPMKTDKTQQVPIMSSSDNIMAFGPNAYAKPAAGLTILRETIMGRELFDAALKNTLVVGLSNNQLLISSVRWKMLQVLIWTGSGVDGSTVLSL